MLIFTWFEGKFKTRIQIESWVWLILTRNLIESKIYVSFWLEIKLSLKFLFKNFFSKYFPPKVVPLTFIDQIICRCITLGIIWSEICLSWINAQSIIRTEQWRTICQKLDKKWRKALFNLPWIPISPRALPNPETQARFRVSTRSVT